MNDATMFSAMKQAYNSFMQDVHTCLPGRIETYNSAKQKANVKPLIKKIFSDGTVQELPVIPNVPVIWPRSKDAILHFPLNKGDGVLLVFSERSLDTWLSKGGDAEPGKPRKFDLSDAIAIPGLYSFVDASPVQDNNSVYLQFKNAKLKLDSSNKVALGNSGQELLDLLDQLLDALIASTTATALGPQPLSKVLDGTVLGIKTDLATIKGSL